MRENVYFKQELMNIILADTVLIVAFALTLSGGVFSANDVGFAKQFELALEICAVGVTLSFILHEMMHKFVAQHFGAIAGFRTSYTGLIITLFTGAMGFLLGIPGATMIYASNFTKRENGLVSLAGPLTNFAVFGAFLAAFYLLNPFYVSVASQLVYPATFLNALLAFTIFISLWLAFFNMLPIQPLDGSKVLAWNKAVYVATLAVIFGLLVFTGIIPYIIPVSGIIFVLIIALLFSTVYRNLF